MVLPRRSGRHLKAVLLAGDGACRIGTSVDVIGWDQSRCARAERAEAGERMTVCGGSLRKDRRWRRRLETGDLPETGDGEGTCHCLPGDRAEASFMMTGRKAGRAGQHRRNRPGTEPVNGCRPVDPPTPSPAAAMTAHAASVNACGGKAGRDFGEGVDRRCSGYGLMIPDPWSGLRRPRRRGRFSRACRSGWLPARSA